jgi:Flp pilus assembly pilin Flp
MFLSLYTKAQTMLFGVRQRVSREEGAVATEYALLIALIAIAMIAAVTYLGVQIASRFTAAGDALTP